MEKLIFLKHVTNDDDQNIVCPSCLSDLTEHEINPDGLCEYCTECTECENCGDFKLPQDMANKEICIDCVEWLDVLKNSNKLFQETHGYGML